MDYRTQTKLFSKTTRACVKEMGLLLTGRLATSEKGVEKEKEILRRRLSIIKRACDDLEHKLNSSRP